MLEETISIFNQDSYKFYHSGNGANAKGTMYIFAWVHSIIQGLNH